MLNSLIFVSVVSSVWPLVTSYSGTSVVQTTSGPIQGEEVSFNGTNYKAFRGIPYAAPPLKELRFKPPQPPKGWTEVRNTSTYSKACPQTVMPVEATDEDCLTLNVYTQSLEDKDLKPVLLWIHGGAYFLGSGPIHGPEYLIQHDLVLVTINYRLGPLGFLATNSSDATGNMGMKDQVAAMKWVKANIVRFGGDPKKVTIYGESAGGASVHLQMFSPLSKGLFQQAIISSGSALNMWAVDTLDAADKYSRELSSLLGASGDVVTDPTKRNAFLRAADANQMIVQSMQLIVKSELFRMLLQKPPFVPIVEAPGTEGAFLVEDPAELLAQGKFHKVPLMIGFNDLEGGLLSMGIHNNYTAEELRTIEQNMCVILAQPLRDAVTAENACSLVAQRIRDVYFGGKGVNTSYMNFLDLWGDLVITSDVYSALRKHAQYAGKDNPVYHYLFAFDGKWNMYKHDFNVTLPGAIHADDVCYAFNMRFGMYPNVSDSSPEVKTTNRMTSLIYNFANTGNPTPTTSDLLPVRWEPSKQNAISTLFIGNEVTLEREVLKNRMGLWEDLDKVYVHKV